jgi:ribonuclease VapC
MTLDTSAVIAVLFSEPGYLELVDRMLDADVLRIGAPTLAEASIVFEARRGPAKTRATPGDAVRDLIKELGVTIVPFGEAEWQRAAQAFARYGRGRHKAALNFGDCLAYATAATAGDALLYVGRDFSHTDLPLGG